MSWTLLLACLWIIGAKLASMRPSPRNHWPLAYGLIPPGLAIVALAFFEHGVAAGWFALATGMVVLRWPVIYLGRKVVNVVKGMKHGATGSD